MRRALCLVALLAIVKAGGAYAPLDLLAPPSLERLRVQAMFGDRAGPTAYVRALGNIRAQRGMKEAFTDGLVRAELYLPAIRRIRNRSTRCTAVRICSRPTRRRSWGASRCDRCRKTSYVKPTT